MQKSFARINIDKVDIQKFPKGMDDPFGLALPQEPVIDEDASQLVSDRPMDQGCGGR
jgi:hypothetical protein